MPGHRGYIVDTNVISELRRIRPDASVLAFVAARELEALYVSCVTIAELRFGASQVLDAELRIAIEAWIKDAVRPMFVERVLDVSEGDMLRWRSVLADGKRRNHTFSQPDLLIAAQALERDLTVVTRNTRDFEPTGVQTLNPWLQA